MPLHPKRARTDEVPPTTQPTDIALEASSDEEYNPSDESASSDSSSQSSRTTPPPKNKIQTVLTDSNTIKKALLTDPQFMIAFSKQQKRQIDPNPERFERSVLDIAVTYSTSDHGFPWLARTTGRSNGSGFIVEYANQKAILTNAHVAELAALITVRLPDENTTTTAKVKVLDHDCDLALLEVDDAEFWNRVEPLKIGAMPNLRSPIAVVGFPRLGNELCITEGFVSRIEVDTCTNGNTEILQLQVSAPLNPGNSGGPMVNHLNEVVGVAFQGSDGDGEGFVIPPQIIKHFLQDALNTTRPYQGFPELAFEFQTMQNADMKRFYGISGTHGILVSKVHALSGLKGILKPGDIILALDNVSVTDDATITTTFSKRIHFDYLVTEKHIGESISARIVRNGEQLDVDLPLLYRAKMTTKGGHLLHDVPPSYLIVTGLVLQTLTDSLIEEKGSAAFSAALESPKKKFGELIVVLSHVFPNKYTKGLEEYGRMLHTITHINGVKIRNLHHARAVLEANTGEFHSLKTKKKYVIPIRNISKEENLRLLAPFEIVKAQSDDLLSPPVYSPGCPEYHQSVEELPLKAKLKA